MIHLMDVVVSPLTLNAVSHNRAIRKAVSYLVPEPPTTEDTQVIVTLAIDPDKLIQPYYDAHLRFFFEDDRVDDDAITDRIEDFVEIPEQFDTIYIQLDEVDTEEKRRRLLERTNFDIIRLHKEASDINELVLATGRTHEEVAKEYGWTG